MKKIKHFKITPGTALNAEKLDFKERNSWDNSWDSEIDIILSPGTYIKYEKGETEIITILDNPKTYIITLPPISENINNSEIQLIKKDCYFTVKTPKF